VLFFSGMLVFLGIVLETGFLADFNLDLDYEAGTFLADSDLSGLRTISNLIFLELLPFSSRLTTIFCCFSAAFFVYL
jgi:hypothetical protein